MQKIAAIKAKQTVNSLYKDIAAIPAKASVTPKQPPNIKDSMTVTETIMKEAQSTIGIGPISRAMIEDEAMVEDSHRNSDQKVFCCPTYGDARDDAGKAFFVKMGMKEKDIDFHSTKMSRNFNNGIMWVSGTPRFVYQVYQAASKLKDRSTFIKTYIPFEAFDRKVALDKLLEERRKKTPNLKTNVRLGNSDFYVMEKIVLPNDFKPWTYVDLSVIDPDNSLPAIKGGRVPEYEVKKYLLEAAQWMEKTKN